MKIENTKAQMRKGVLEFCILSILEGGDAYTSEILAQLKAHYADVICEPIRYNVRLSEAPGYGQTIFEYAPRSPGAADYQRLTERILRDGQS